MGKKFNVSFIGSGYMAREHAKAFKDDSNFNLIGVYSRNILHSQNFAQEFDLKIVARNIEELYHQTESEVVIVAVPELSLPEVLQKSFTFPWVHLLEKPVGINIKIANEILFLQNKLKARAFVGLNRRFYSGILNLKNRLDLDNEKRVLVIHDQENRISALESGQPDEVVKNWHFANSIHLIDLIRYVCRGSVEEVFNYKSIINESVTYIHSVIEFSSGDTGVYHCIWNNPGPWSLACYVNNEYWEMKPLENTSRRVLSNNSQNVIQSEWDINFKPGLRMQVQEIYKYLISDNCNLPTIGDAYNSMKLVDRIYAGF